MLLSIHYAWGMWPYDYPLTDRAEIEECRLILGMPVRYGEIDEYDSAAELGAARDLELWGYNPFEEN